MISSAFPQDFIYRESHALNWTFYLLWLVIPLETWIAIWIGTASPDDLLALLALVFYKAVALILGTLIVFRLMPALARRSTVMDRFARRSPVVSRLARRMTSPETGGMRSWAAALFLFWFSTAAVWWFACVLAWALSSWGVLVPNDLVAAFINKISHYAPEQWYGQPISQSSMMMVAVSFAYSAIAYMLLLLINSISMKRRSVPKKAHGPSPNGLAIFLIVAIVNAVFLALIKETALPS